MHSENLVIVADISCSEIYDYSISDKAEVILENFSGDDLDLIYVKVVDHHADLFITNDDYIRDYFIENGIMSVCLS